MSLEGGKEHPKRQASVVRGFSEKMRWVEANGRKKGKGASVCWVRNEGEEARHRDTDARSGAGCDAITGIRAGESVGPPLGDWHGVSLAHTAASPSLARPPLLVRPPRHGWHRPNGQDPPPRARPKRGRSTRLLPRPHRRRHSAIQGKIITVLATDGPGNLHCGYGRAATCPPITLLQPPTSALPPKIKSLPATLLWTAEGAPTGEKCIKKA